MCILNTTKTILMHLLGLKHLPLTHCCISDTEQCISFCKQQNLLKKKHDSCYCNKFPLAMSDIHCQDGQGSYSHNQMVKFAKGMPFHFFILLLYPNGVKSSTLKNWCLERLSVPFARSDYANYELMLV